MTTLAEFAETWMEKPVFRPPADIYARVAGNVGITLYRDERFQVQLWACEPGAEIGDHKHPNLRGYAVRVGGEIHFRRGGKAVTRADTILATLCGKHTMMHSVEPGVSHGATVGPSGASFLAISEWVTEPKSVHLDWDGPPLDEKHAMELR